MWFALYLLLLWFVSCDCFVCVMRFVVVPGVAFACVCFGFPIGWRFCFLIS